MAKDKILSLRLPGELFQKLEQLAQHEGASVSEVIRTVLAQNTDRYLMYSGLRHPSGIKRVPQEPEEDGNVVKMQSKRVKPPNK